MRKTSRSRLLVTLASSLGLVLPMLGGEALAKKGLDDSTRPDDSKSSSSGSSSSGSGTSGGSGSSGSSGSAEVSGGRDGYDRVSDSREVTVDQKLEQALQGSSLDSRTRNDRDLGDRFR